MTAATSLEDFRISQKLMGCDFELVIVEQGPKKAAFFLQSGIQEIQRIEALLSEFKSDSETSLINESAAERSVTVSSETFQLIRRCKEISRITQGAFDITTAPLKKLYSFKNQHSSFPSIEKISEALHKTGDNNLELPEENKISFKKHGIYISFAAIGKGYAADCVTKLWKKMRVKAGVVNASGDLTVWGNRADGNSWKVGIAHPDTKNEIIGWIPVKDGSVATSGDYEQFFIADGIRYSHNINPKTGLPLSGIKSVTITGPSAELCDALCTAVNVMGTSVGLHFINQLPGVHCLIIDDRNTFHHSKNLVIEYV